MPAFLAETKGSKWHHMVMIELPCVCLGFLVYCASTKSPEFSHKCSSQMILPLYSIVELTVLFLWKLTMGIKLSVNSRGQTAPKPQLCHILEDKFPKLSKAMRYLWQTFLFWGVRISSSNHNVQRRLLWPRSLPFTIKERIWWVFCVCFLFLFLLPAPSLPLPSFIIWKSGWASTFPLHQS